MAKTTRTAVIAAERQESIISDLKSMGKAVTLYAKFMNQKSALESQLAERIQAEKDKFALKIGPLTSDADRLYSELIGYAESHREEVFDEGSKRREFLAGYVGYRQGRKKLEAKNNKWDTVLTALLERDGKEFVRVKYDVDKVQLLSRSEEPEVKELMKKLGVKVKAEEVFYVDLK